MGDERLEQLRRAWEATRSPMDELAFLKERVRVGDLDPARVSFAAALGSPSAAQVLGREPGPVVEQPSEWVALIDLACEVLQKRTELMRFGVAVGRVREAHADPSSLQLLELVEEWILCPSEERERALNKSKLILVATTLMERAPLEVAFEVIFRPLDAPSAAEPLEAWRAGAAADLAPWLLGLRDPLAERVAQRNPR